MRKLNVTQASLFGLLTAIVGQVVAYVPSLQPEESRFISVGGFMLGAIFGIVHMIDDAREGKIKVTLNDLEDGVRGFAADEFSKHQGELVAEAEKALAGKVPSLADIEQTIQTELRKLLAGAVSSTPVTPPPAAAVVTPPPAAAVVSSTAPAQPGVGESTAPPAPPSSTA